MTSCAISVKLRYIKGYIIEDNAVFYNGYVWFSTCNQIGQPRHLTLCSLNWFSSPLDAEAWIYRANCSCWYTGPLLWQVISCLDILILTRQHSTQSVGNMPPPSPRHLLPHVLQIMPRNPKYDQFQPKGHHNEENLQNMTKMPGNPKFYPFH